MCNDKQNPEGNTFDKETNNPFTGTLESLCISSYRKTGDVDYKYNAFRLNNMFRAMWKQDSSDHRGKYANFNEGDYLVQYPDGELWGWHKLSFEINFTIKPEEKLDADPKPRDFPVIKPAKPWMFLGSEKWNNEVYGQTLIMELRHGVVLRMQSFRVSDIDGILDPPAVSMIFIPGATKADFLPQLTKSKQKAVYYDEAQTLMRSAVKDLYTPGHSKSIGEVAAEINYNNYILLRSDIEKNHFVVDKTFSLPDSVKDFDLDGDIAPPENIFDVGRYIVQKLYRNQCTLLDQENSGD